METKIYHFPPHGDDRGQLVAIEAMKDLPFEIKRVYYIYDTLPGVRRGFHAHLNLQQILLCVNGSCKIHLDDGSDTAEVLLDKPLLKANFRRKFAFRNQKIRIFSYWNLLISFTLKAK